MTQSYSPNRVIPCIEDIKMFASETDCWSYATDTIETVDFFR